MSSMQKAKKMKLSDYEIHHTLGTGFWIKFVKHFELF